MFHKNVLLILLSIFLKIFLILVYDNKVFIFMFLKKLKKRKRKVRKTSCLKLLDISLKYEEINKENDRL